MKLLKEKILSEGKALNENILKVDGFINHLVDPALMAKIGEEFGTYFANQGITKIVTVESAYDCARYESSDDYIEKRTLQNIKSEPLSDCRHFLYERDQL